MQSTVEKFGQRPSESAKLSAPSQPTGRDNAVAAGRRIRHVVGGVHDRMKNSGLGDEQAQQECALDDLLARASV